MSQTDGPQAMANLRRMALTTAPSELGMLPDSDFPDVYGVLVDWPIGDNVATLLALRDGTASLYTTSTFGIIGGHGHAEVRKAAQACTRAASAHLRDSELVSDYPLPAKDEVYLHLLTYSGVKRRTGSLPAMYDGSDPSVGLFGAAQHVLTQLRLVTEPRPD